MKSRWASWEGKFPFTRRIKATGVFVKVGEVDEEKVKKDPFLTEPDADIPSEIFIIEDDNEEEEPKEEQ